jgi:hypothetical protein
MTDHFSQPCPECSHELRYHDHIGCTDSCDRPANTCPGCNKVPRCDCERPAPELDAATSMRTRDVLRWNESARGLADLALFIAGCAALHVLASACDALERRLDAWADGGGASDDGKGHASDMCDTAAGRAGPPGDPAATGAGDAPGSSGFGPEIWAGWRMG